MRQHYRFDYQKAKPNRFADKFGEESMAVVPDLDVEDQALENDDMLSEYDFSGGVRGKHCAAYREGHAVEVHKADTTGELESAEDDTWGDAHLATEASQRPLEKLADEGLSEIEAEKSRPMIFPKDGEFTPG